MAAHADTVARHLARFLRKRHAQLAPEETDLDRLRAYHDRPIEFAREVLGLKHVPKFQRQILNAILLKKRVAVRSGHKMGKSTAYAIAALWFYCTRPEARVVIMAATNRQVNGIIWREIRRLLKKSKIPIPGAPDVGILAQTGLVNQFDLSEIKGYTAKDQEAVAGVSGPAIMYLLDEASGIEEPIHQAVQGNTAGGNAWVLMISNPTKGEGTFFDAFHAKSEDAIGKNGWHCIHGDSRESPNITNEFGEQIPGLATAEWVDMMRDEWGEDSAQFAIRVKGDFVAAEELKIFPLALIGAAQERWADASEEGRLWIGVDPAGAGAGGDESAFAARRGLKILEVKGRRGLNEEGHLLEILDLIQKHKLDGKREPGLPVVVVDAGGDVGSRVLATLRTATLNGIPPFEIVVLRTSDKAPRQPKIYHLLRDELAANARAWFKSGGSIPLDNQLEKDLHVLEFRSDQQDRLKLQPKEELRKLLGRSPDRGDAVMHCLWEPGRFRNEEPAQKEPAMQDDDPLPGPILDPYSAMSAWRGGSNGSNGV